MTAGGGRALLEVVVAQERDVPGAVAGGADRLHLATAEGLAPEPAVVSAVCREAGDVAVHVVLRPDGPGTLSGGGLARLGGVAQDHLSCGATGVAFGFLDADLEVDADACRALAEQLPGVPWTFTGAFDATLDPRRSWRRVLGLPGLVGVRSAGSPQGMSVGYDDLLAAAADPAVARLLVAGGGLQAEHVPWLVRAGVRQFSLGTQVRPGASPRAYVDGDHVRSWRLLLDAATERVARAAGR